MRHEFLVWFGATLLLSVAFGTASDEAPDENSKEKEQIGYSVGFQVGGDFRRQGLDVNIDMVVQGVLDALAGVEPRISSEDMRRTLVDLQDEVEAERTRQLEELAVKNLAEGAAFLADNGKKEGVETLPSGVQFRIIRAGSGSSPRPADTVTVHYRGTLIDGSEFDSSYDRDEPATFQADAVIAGWQEVLPRMKEGARWEMFIPAELAYGETGAGNIGPNQTLIFEIELLSVEAAESSGGKLKPVP